MGYQLTKAPAPAPSGRPAGKPAPVRLVVASQVGEAEFHESTLLGRSLARMPKALRPALTLIAGNTGAGADGLPTIYNRALDAATDGEILVYVHDDVHLHDWQLVARAREATARFDVAGIAGAREPDLTQPSWYWRFDDDLTRLGVQSGRLSGSVNHGEPDWSRIRVFGPTPAACRLLDGVLLIVAAERVRAAGARFDEQFRFHHYDIDFCRTAGERGLRIGTWPISITHSSTGAFNSDGFRASAREYLAKWGGWPAPVATD